MELVEYPLTSSPPKHIKVKCTGSVHGSLLVFTNLMLITIQVANIIVMLGTLNPNFIGTFLGKFSILWKLISGQFCATEMLFLCAFLSNHRSLIEAN